MMRPAIILLVSLFVGACSATVFNNLTGLGRQPPVSAAQPRRFSHSFSHVDWRGRKTDLHYQTEVSEHVFHVREFPSSMQLVACAADSVSFAVDAGVAISSLSLPQVGQYLSADLSAGCKNTTSGAPTTMQRRVTAMTVTEGAAGKSTIEFATVGARINEMLRHAKVRFATNAFHNETATNNKMGKPKRRDLTSWLESTASDAWSSLVSDVGGVAGAVQDLVTGDVNIDDNLLGSHGDFGFNYNPSTQSAAKVYDLAQLAGHGASLSVTCSNCYASLNTALQFDLDISDYTLETFSLVASATATVNVEVTFTAQYSGSWSGSTNVFTYTGPTVVVDIGIPVTLSIELPLQAGYSASLDAEASADTYFTATGTVSYGTKYTAANGWAPVQSDGLNWNAGIKSVTGTVNGNALAYLVPGLTITAYGSLDVGMALIPYVKAGVQYNLNGVSASAPGYDIEATADYGLNIKFDASINFGGMDQISSWNSPQYNLVNQAFPSSPYFFDYVGSDGDGSGSRSIQDNAQVIDDSAAVRTAVSPSMSSSCNAAISCNGKGALDCSTNTCHCSNGWSGASCNVPPARVIVPLNATRSGNASHTALISVDADRVSVIASGFCPSRQCAVLQASELETCKHLAGQPSCVPLEGVAALDAEVGKEIASVMSVGPRCMAAMRHHLCSLRFPQCTPSTARMTPMCFLDCVSNYEACDLSNKVATALCHGASSARNGSTVAPPAAGGVFQQHELCSGSRSVNASGSARSCVVAENLEHCTHLNGKKVVMTHLAFSSPQEADGFVGSIISNSTFSSEDCKGAALSYKCAQFLPLCGGVDGDDADWPMRMSRDTCLSLLGGCELPSVADRACNASTARWVNDTIAPAFMASSFSASSEEMDYKNGTWKVPVIATVCSVGVAAALAAWIGYVVHSRRQARRKVESEMLRASVGASSATDTELEIRTE